VCAVMIVESERREMVYIGVGGGGGGLRGTRGGCIACRGGFA